MQDNRYQGVAEYTPVGESIYSLFARSCDINKDKPALSYYGKEITFKALSNRINRVASALVAMGISKGDRVIVSLPSIPEAVELFYAVNKIGAIFCGMDCRSTSAEISEIIEQVNPKVCFVADFHLKSFVHIHNIPIVCVSFIKTISVLAAFASVFVEFFTGRAQLIARRPNFMTYGKFVSKNLAENMQDVKVDADEVCAYFYTSGTTYGRKCAVLTNENLNSLVVQYTHSQPGLDQTERFCTIMPLFTCYGITLGMHLPLTLGKQVRLNPLFDGKNMKKLLLAEKPGYITTVPAHWDHFMKDNFAGVDLSFFKGAIIGGDKLCVNDEEKINAILASCNSTARVMCGYGLTEASTAVTVIPPDTPIGSVGVGLCWSPVAIFEPGTDIPVPNGEKGEICVCGPNVCKGYLDDAETTARLLKKHSDGKVWLHSGDIGYFDKDNFLYFCERIKRIFVRFDGTKVSPYGIEQQLIKCPVVEYCLVYAIDDKEHQYGKCPAVMVVFKEGYDRVQAQNIFEEFIQTDIAPHLRPVEIQVVDALPVTRGGKFDYFYAEKQQKTLSDT